MGAQANVRAPVERMWGVAHRVKFAPVREALIQFRYMRLFGIKGSREARQSQRAEYRDYQRQVRRGHKIKKAHKKRDRR